MNERERQKIIAVVPIGRITRAALKYAESQGIARNVICDITDRPDELNFDDLNSKGKTKPGWGKA